MTVRINQTPGNVQLPKIPRLDLTGAQRGNDRQAANIANSQAKLHEVGFTGAIMAARLRRDDSGPTPTPVTNSSAKSAGTEATYQIGSPTRPNIRHDNGFLQNPNDPSDPTPIPTVPPSQADQDYYNDQLSQVRWAQRVDNLHIPFTDKDDYARKVENGIEAYRHFLEGNGADRNFSYDEFVSEDSNGTVTLNNAIADTQRGVEDIYAQMIADDPSLAGKPVTFNITGGRIGVGDSAQFPYPDSENWQKAIGGHSIWNSATVTVTPSDKPGGRPTFSMDYTLHAEDRYNFNPGQHDIATGVPDATRGKLEQTGLGHQYMQYGTLEREVTWTQGNISNSTSVSNPNDR